MEKRTNSNSNGRHAVAHPATSRESGTHARGTPLSAKEHGHGRGAASAPAAPAALKFTRQSQTTGEFTWEPVVGGTSYAVFVDGMEVQNTAKTTATLEIGAGDVEGHSGRDAAAEIV